MTEAMAEPATEAQVRSSARSRAYALFLEALEYPDEELFVRVLSGQTASEMEDILGDVSESLLEGFDSLALSDCTTLEDLQVEHTRLFDGAVARQATPLYGSAYVQARDRVVEEPLRFYDYFGLKISEENREFPDYLGIQLEFLHFLSYCQTGAIPEIEDTAPYANAEQDFLQRHPGYWFPMMMERLTKKDPAPYYRELVRLLHKLMVHCAYKPIVIDDIDVDD